MEELFERLGLNKKEAAAFLELVRLGACPISRWAKHAGINRSSMYVILDRLKEEKLVSEFIHRGVRHVQAVPVSELALILRDRQQQLADTQHILELRLPDLAKLQKTRSLTPKISFYEGIARVEQMYEEVLKETAFTAFFHPSRVKKFSPTYFHKIPRTLRAHGGRAKELLIRCKEADEYIKLYQSKRHEIKRLPPGITFFSDTIVSREKMYLVGYGKRDVVGTKIWNEELAKTQKAIFDLIWKLL